MVGSSQLARALNMDLFSAARPNMFIYPVRLCIRFRMSVFTKHRHISILFDENYEIQKQLGPDREERMSQHEIISNAPHCHGIISHATSYHHRFTCSQHSASMANCYSAPKYYQSVTSLPD
uniref:Uncharacterized protein n=1 Tax=Bionectria ochroleuca TaxID=29856 RepID=A0A8H7TTY7_BIOOC